MAHFASHVDTRMRYYIDGRTVRDRKDENHYKTFDTDAEAAEYADTENMKDFYSTSNGMMNGPVTLGNYK